jgi:hypothetical protein
LTTGILGFFFNLVLVTQTHYAMDNGYADFFVTVLGKCKDHAQAQSVDHYRVQTGRHHY